MGWTDLHSSFRIGFSPAAIIMFLEEEEKGVRGVGQEKGSKK